MRKMVAFVAAIPALTLAFAVQSPARAETTAPEGMGVCQQRLTEVKAEWKASPIPTSGRRAAGWGSNGTKGHDHPGMVTSYMQRQLVAAEQSCVKGEEHEALLRVDLVRAWLKLPFEEHPASHNYHPKT